MSDETYDLAVFAEYARILGSSVQGDVGEAATLAWAETHSAIAIIDDQAARNAMHDTRFPMRAGA